MRDDVPSPDGDALPARPSHAMPTAADARALARRRLPRLIFDFIDGGAGSEATLARNRAGLAALRLMPRVLADAPSQDLSVGLFGRRFGLPVGIAPMGMCDLAWPGTDHAFAAEAARRGFPVAVSTASSTPLEAMIRRAEGHAWFQLYVTGSVDAAFALTDRAAAAGYEVLLLTVDVPRLGRRPRDLRNGFETPFRLRARHLLDFATHPRWSLETLAAGKPRMANFGTGPKTAGYDRKAARIGADWAFLDRLRARWKGRLVVKGVMDPGDAARIRAAGADAIYVSNHGGRQLDSAPAPIAALGAIRAALGAGYPLILDGGVRSGEDIVKARAAGADFVLMGRPFLWAMGGGGAAGLSRFLDGIAEDIAVALAQLGLARFDALGPDALAPI
jgi:isopentenyl diphosphate isomerase/L-lactate dehydrogenase-like FMN-dependent dehydrogenase